MDASVPVSPWPILAHGLDPAPFQSICVLIDKDRFYMAIRPEILRWARETAGLSLEDAAHATGLKTAYGHSGADRLAQMEAGQTEPPRNLLVKMSEAYRRPLL